MKAKLQTEYGHPVDEIEIPYTQDKLPGVLLHEDRAFVFHELMGYPGATAYYRENTIHIAGNRSLEVKLVYQGRKANTPFAENVAVTPAFMMNCASASLIPKRSV